jgi:hypothetical protein
MVLSNAQVHRTRSGYGINTFVPKDEAVFSPPVRLGLAVYGTAAAGLTAAGVLGLIRAANADIGLVFLAYLAPALAAVILAPVAAYRAYSLFSASYILQRDGIRLRWGLRQEDIPMDSILWVRPATSVEAQVPLSLLRLTGALPGMRILPELGPVEFLAAGSGTIIFIATKERVFAISPRDPEGFIQEYRHYAERGSLSPLAARSVYPSFLISRVWASLPARYLIVAGFSLSLVLLVLVSLTIPERTQISLGLRMDGSPRDMVPSVRLMLLPVLNGLVYLLDLLLGLFFFWKEESRPYAYLMWGGGAVTPVLFLVALATILSL